MLVENFKEWACSFSGCSSGGQAEWSREMNGFLWCTFIAIKQRPLKGDVYEVKIRPNQNHEKLL